MNASYSRRRRLILAAGLAGLLPSCKKQPEQAAAPPPEPPAPPRDWLLTPGAPPPDWSQLDAWQDRVTREQFERLLREVLSDGSSWFSHVEIREDAAHLRMSTTRVELPRYVLRFAKPGTAASAGARYWRRLEELPPLRDPARPLQDVHIALDPGHIGGFWAKMEERFVQPGTAPPVKEGEITLRTARVLAPMLEALGARVSHVRRQPEPLTKLRPEQLRSEARASLEQDGKEITGDAIQKEAERLFYRTAEIRARGGLVNDTLQPDMVLCLHYNGSGNGSTFTTENHLHILAHGNIGPGEAVLDDQRLDGLLRLVQGVPDTEIPLCVAVAKRMAEATGLPPYSYPGSSGRMVPGQPYVWTRNLLANRVYRCPVVFLEPYLMNNAQVIERLHAGDYEGTANIAGVERISIFREYAGGVTAGLRDFFSARRA